MTNISESLEERLAWYERLLKEAMLLDQEKDQEIERLKGDCRTMASWFKDLIEDDYPFNEDDYPAYTAAMKYINPDELTLRVRPEDPPCSS